MTTHTREVTWGEAIVVAAFKHPGGLRQAVDRIRATVGPMIGVRNTFSKLYSVTDPAMLTDKDLFRGWLLLTALGEDPADWLIFDTAVPAGFSIETLRCAIRDSNPEPAD